MPHDPGPRRGRVASATRKYSNASPRRDAARPALLALAALFLAAGAGTGCAQGRAPSARFVDQAERLHDAALASAVTPDPDLAEYIQEIGTRLEKAAQDVAPEQVRGPFFRSMQFHLVDVPLINVFTTGGRHVYVYRGLFEFCESEEELAAAMAHAYAHALNLDVENTGMNPADGDPPLREVVWEFVVNRFDAAQEEAADRLAYRLYARAGWDPARFDVLFGRLSDRPGGTAAAAADRLTLAERGARARGMTVGTPKKGRPVADPRTFDALHERAKSLVFASDAAGRWNTDPLKYLVAFPNCLLPQDEPHQRVVQDQLRPAAPPTVDVEPN